MKKGLLLAVAALASLTVIANAQTPTKKPAPAPKKVMAKKTTMKGKKMAKKITAPTKKGN